MLDERRSPPQLSEEELKPIVRRNSVLLAGALMLVWAGRQLLPTFGGLIGTQLTGDRAFGGAMFAIYMLCGSFGAWQAGKWLDRSGRRPALAVAFVVAAVGSSVVGLGILSRSFPVALAGSGVMGLGLGAGQLARLAAADMQPLKRRAKAISYVMMGGAVGAIFGPAATAAVAVLGQERGLSPILGPWLAFPFAFLAGVPLILSIHPDPREIGARVAQLYAADQPVARSARLRNDLLRLRPVWTAIVAITALETTMVMIMAIVPLGMADLGYPMALISLLMSIHFFGMFGLSIPIGSLADRIGRKPLLLAGCVVSALGCFLISRGTSPWLIGPGFYGVGLGWSLTYLTATTILSDVTQPFERGGLIGLMDFSVAIGGALAALVGGWVYSQAGLGAVGLLGLALTLLPLTVGFQLREKRAGIYHR